MAKDAQLTDRDVRITELERKLTEVTQLVISLRDQLGRNSRNSHLPPSSDGPGARPSGGSSPVGARKRGGQPGHGGNKRELLPPDEVDAIVELYPKACENCWLALPRVRSDEATRYQVTELPPIRPHTTEYRCNAVTCTCGYTTVAKAEGVVPTSPFGPRLMALIALLTGVYHLSRRRSVTLLRDVLGVRISLGALSSVEGRVGAALEPVVQEVWSKVDDAAVKHADATSWLLSGKLRSLWTIATKAVTVFKILVDGSSASVKPIFGACRGILVSDRATVFCFWTMSLRQICWAHLLRKFVSFSERDGPARSIGNELLDYTVLIFDYWHDLQAGKIDRRTFRAWLAPVRLRVEECLARAVAATVKDVSGACADILEHKEALWTFVERDEVEPTNNHAERELRAFVLWRKKSFGAQSERGNLFAERIMTVAHTARKQDKNVFAFLTECLGGTGSPSLFAAP
ncbi:MAG: IS66 family transposase [Polyangiaceae bacterium]